MKILYYELIRMLTNYEREQCRDQELYEYTRSITKIEGYQVSKEIHVYLKPNPVKFIKDLTNRLQRFLNHRFMLDIDELSRKCAGDNITKSQDVHYDHSKLQQLEFKVEQILEDNIKLKSTVTSLSSTNQVLEKEIIELKEKFASYHPKHTSSQKLQSSEIITIEKQFHQDESNSSELSDKANVQNEDIANVTDKMQSIISQANILLINDATHLERIFNLETHVSEINGKLLNLEAADLYLQEAHRVLNERTSLIENYSKYIEEKVKLVTSQPNSSHQENISYKYEELEKRIACLEKFDSHQDENLLGQNITKEDIEISKETEDKVSSNHSDLYENYQHILGRILKMEELLTQQAQTISDYSELFSDKYFKLLASNNDKSKQTELTKLTQEKISEIKREERISISKISELTKLKSINNNCSKDCYIFDFIETLMGMNKSMNQMVEDFVSCQLQLKSLKSQQKSIFEQIHEHNKNFQYHNTEFYRLNEKVESEHVKEVMFC